MSLSVREKREKKGVYFIYVYANHNIPMVYKTLKIRNKREQTLSTWATNFGDIKNQTSLKV